MRKKYIVGTIACVILLGTITGCGSNSNKEVSVPEQDVTAVEDSEAMTVSDFVSIETPAQTADVSSEAMTEPESVANTLAETNGTDVTGENATYVEETPESLFYEYDAMFNSEELNLQPRIGEFLTEDEAQDYQIVEHADGNLYGYNEDYWGGCSVWCAITEHKEKAEASSFLQSQGDCNFGTENIISHSRVNAWAEGVDGDGIGEYISITKSYDNGGEYGEWDCFFFPDLCIVNGMAQNKQAWKEHGRVKKLKMYFNEEYICDLELLDTMKPQYISLSGLHLSAKNKENSTFKFEIAEVYKGELYEDTALTGIEIQVYTKNH